MLTVPCVCVVLSGMLRRALPLIIIVWSAFAAAAACDDQLCTEDLCPNGLARRTIGDRCCACDGDDEPCYDVACTTDACPNGRGRRPIGDDCCACDAPGPSIAAIIGIAVGSGVVVLGLLAAVYMKRSMNKSNVTGESNPSVKA